MATHLVEEGREKCARYWPEPGRTMRAGTFNLKTTEVRPGRGCTVSTIQLTNTKAGAMVGV